MPFGSTNAPPALTLGSIARVGHRHPDRDTQVNRLAAFPTTHTKQPKFMQQRIVTLLLALACVARISAQSSSFDSDPEGWLLAGPDPGAHISSPPATSAATHTATGLPAGGIVISDTFHWTWLQAPAGYLGDRGSSYGQTISFDILINYTDGVPYPAFALRGATHTLYYNAMLGTGTWQTVTAPLTPAGWRLDNYAGTTQPTEQQFRDVLADLRGIYVLVEWHTGDDLTYFDNFFFGIGTDTPPALTIQRVDSDQVKIDFNGVLQTSTNLTGWQDMNPQPLSPLTLTIEPGAKFFRARRR